EIANQFPVPSLVIRLGRPRQSQIQVRQPDRPFRIHEAVRVDNVEPAKSVIAFKTIFNTPFARVLSLNFDLGSLASQIIRFDLELPIALKQDPDKPVGDIKNTLWQIFFVSAN